MTVYVEALERLVGALQRITDPGVKERFVGNWENPRAVAFLQRSWPGLVWSLAHSEPIYVGREICDLLGSAVRQGVPAWTLDDDLPLVPRGFCWFERNPGYEDDTDPNAELAALSWAPYWVSRVVRDGVEQSAFTVDGPAPGAQSVQRILMFHPWYAPRQVPGRQVVAPWLPLVMSFGASSAQRADVTLDGVARADLTPTQVADTEFLAGLFGALSLFAKQRLLVAPRQDVDRAARKRLERAGSPFAPLVRVVHLRARASAGPEGGAEPVDWSCRWVVRGHWRQQACGAGRAERRPIWITPHVKGPESKPLKAPRATVFAVVR